MISGSAYNTTYILFSFAKRKGQKSQFHCGAVCNAQKKPVRLFNFICFFLFWLSRLILRNRKTFSIISSG